MATQKNSSIRTRELVYCALFAAMTAIGAFIKVPVPVVPFTLQFLFANLAGLLLGARLGAFSIGVYIITGLAGLPIFTSGGGPGYIMQPTFGYIIGFMAGAWICGHIAQGSEGPPSFKRLLAAGFANITVVYIFGMVYYYFIANYYINSPIGLWTLLFYCFVLAVPGDLLLCFISAVLAKRLIPILRRSNNK